VINHHISAALAVERRNTLLAEAQADHQTKHARLHRQQTRTSAARKPLLRWNPRWWRPDWSRRQIRPLHQPRFDSADHLRSDPFAAQTETVHS
jgi:hypothetical protein